jgi:hypothetical protein
MPDARRHRGAHPEDARLFAPEALPTLRRATADLCWLLDQGYSVGPALRLVGDRFALTDRQRIAIRRCSCSESQRTARMKRAVSASELDGATIWIDGFNVLTTVEAALAGGVLLLGRDGALRDMASMHGSYRRVAETEPAIAAIAGTLRAFGVGACRWWLDAPVSNSGRLASMLRAYASEQALDWEVEVVPDPDARLRSAPADVVVATADSGLMDAAPRSWQLAREVVARLEGACWLVAPAAAGGESAVDALDHRVTR